MLADGAFLQNGIMGWASFTSCEIGSKGVSPKAGFLKHRVDGVADFDPFLASAQLGDFVEQGLLGAIEHAQLERDRFGVLRIEHFCAAVRGDAEHLIVERVFNVYGDIDAARHHDFRCGFDARLRGARVGAHKPARAQEHTAEIASDHANHIGEPRMLQRFKRWHAGGFLWLAVV